LNLIGAAILYTLAQIKEYNSFYWMMLLYCITFAPTIALTSSICMRQMTNPAKEFPAIRVLGTIAWIAVTNLVGYMGWGDKATIFHVSMVTAIAIGLFAFTLPKTPPTLTGSVSLGQIAGKDAFVLFRNPSFSIFFIASVLICIPLSFYYALANPSITDAYISAFQQANPNVALTDEIKNSFFVENKMSLGQASEIIFMLMLPLAYARFGIKNILIIGLLAWIIRFFFFGYGNAGSGEWMLYGGILLHGICYDFFFVSGMIYTDEKAGEKIKSSAQGLISLATYGLGMYIGSVISGWAKDYYSTKMLKEGKEVIVSNWTGVWNVPAVIAIAVLLLFLVFFKSDKKTAQPTI
jgi:nucleoside transporter